MEEGTQKLDQCSEKGRVSPSQGGHTAPEEIGACPGPSEGVEGSSGEQKDAGLACGTPEEQPQEKAELRTSDFYTTASNIPKRFDHPGKLYSTTTKIS